MIAGIPFYSEGKFLLEKAKEYWDKYSKEKRIEKIKTYESSFGNSKLHHFLKWKYNDENILNRCNEVYPVAIYPAPETQINDPETVLHSLQKICPKDNQLNPKNANYRECLEITERRLEDRPTFTMAELITTPKLELKCEIGSYFRSLDTCEALSWEIASKSNKLKDVNEEDFKKFDELLSMRSQIHNQINNPVINGKFRSAAIGISTLLAYKDDGKYNLWLRRRSPTKVALGANRIHVIPSFMFQPSTAFLDEEFSVKHNIYREYLEEIFSIPEAKEGEGDWQYFYGDPNLQFLKKLIDSGEAKLYLSGIAINLFNLRPEVCTVLLIKSSKWYTFHCKNPSSKKKFCFNSDEWARTSGSSDYLELIIAKLPLMKKDSDYINEISLKPKNIVPPGAAAFWLGIDTLRKVL